MIRGLVRSIVKSNISSLVGIRSEATLAADFTTSIPAAFTFTRASSGTYVNSSGVIATATTDAARHEYNPVTLAARGVLIEGARTNLALQSQTRDTTWSLTQLLAFGSGSVVDATTGPDGATTAEKIVENTATAGRFIAQGSMPKSSGVTMTLTSFQKAAERTRMGLALCDASSFGNRYGAEYNLSAGTAGAAAGAQGTFSAGSNRITNYGNSWYRSELTCTTSTEANVAVREFLFNATATTSSTSYTGDNTSGSYIHGCQVEVGAFASSYIITTTAAVTRAADSLDSTGATFAAWYRQDQGTFVIEADSPGVGTRTVFQVDDGTANNRIVVWTTGTTCKADIITGGVSQTGGGLSLGTITAYTAFKVALAFRVNDVAACVTGGTVQTDTSVTLPTVDRAKAGASTTAGEEIFGHLVDVTFFPGRRSDNFLSWAVL